MSGLGFYCGTSEESVVLNTFFPEIFAFITTLEEELHCVFVITLKI